MLYADANIIVRYIINDDEIMAEKAEIAVNDRQIFSFDKKLNSFIARKKTE